MKKVSFTLSGEAFEILAELSERFNTTPNMIARAFLNGGLEHVAALGRLNETDTDNTFNPTDYNETTASTLEPVRQFPGVYSERADITVQIEIMENEGGVPYDPYWDERGKQHQSKEGDYWGPG